MSEQEFVYPEVHQGDPVLVRGDPTSATVYGWVIEAKNQAIDAMVVTRKGVSKRRDVWHEGDPRIITHAHQFEDGDRGIFALAPSELDRRELHKRLDEMEKLLDQLVVQVQGRAIANAKPGKKPRG